MYSEDFYQILEELKKILVLEYKQLEIINNLKIEPKKITNLSEIEKSIINQLKEVIISNELPQII